MTDAERAAIRERIVASTPPETKKVMSTGVGESKIFAAPEGDLPKEVNILECHIGGKPVPECGFTPEQLAILTYGQTDEGKVGKTVGTYTPPGREPLDRMIADGAQGWETPDVLGDTAAPFKKPGFRQRYLGQARTEQAGLRRWQPMKKDNGDLVRVGRGLFLAEMPEELAARRQAAVAAETRAQRQEAFENLKTHQERFQRDSGLAIKPGEVLRDYRTDATVQEGVHVRRGNTTEDT